LSKQKDGDQAFEFATGSPGYIAPEYCRKIIDDEALPDEYGVGVEEYDCHSPVSMYKTDVFAFGVLLSSMVMKGQPYPPQLKDKDLLQGCAHFKLRPLLPKEVCPRFVYLMQLCWAEEPIDRPTFCMLRTVTEQMLDNWEDDQKTFEATGKVPDFLLRSLDRADRTANTTTPNPVVRV